MHRLALALAVLALTGLASPALGQSLTYDFQWEVRSQVNTYEPTTGTSVSRYAFSGQGPVTLSALPGTTPQLTLTFADATASGRATFALFPGLTPIATDNFGFTTGIPGSVPSPAFTGTLQGPIAIYTPKGNPLDPSGFTLTMTEFFDCGGLPALTRCGGVGGWSASLLGTATLVGDPPATAAEPWPAGLLAAGLLAALVGRYSGCVASR